jgi:hypothetical protein
LCFMSCKLLAGDCSNWGACLFASSVYAMICYALAQLFWNTSTSWVCDVIFLPSMYCLSHSNFVYKAGIFLSPILWGWWVGDHPQGDLFDYRSERTLELFRILAMFWWHVGTYCLNIANSAFLFPLKYGYN